jgi:hypothetical protein
LKLPINISNNDFKLLELLYAHEAYMVPSICYMVQRCGLRAKLSLSLTFTIISLLRQNIQETYFVMNMDSFAVVCRVVYDEICTHKKGRPINCMV